MRLQKYCTKPPPAVSREKTMRITLDLATNHQTQVNIIGTLSTDKTIWIIKTEPHRKKVW